MAETPEQIHDRMLQNTSDSFDKSNGSFIWDAEKAGAIEFSLQQERIDEAVRRMNIVNLTGDDLSLAVYERTGIERRQAVKAQTHVVITGSIGAKIKKGDMVSTDEINFISLEDKTIEKGTTMTVLVECEIPGDVGNVPAKAIKKFPTTLEGLSNVYNEKPVINGYDEESDEQLLERYFERLRNPGKSGNAAHYRDWAKEVEGVGDVKVFPTFNGPLTVEVIVINQNNEVANAELIQKVKKHIEEEMPFGVDELSVKSATPLAINLNVQLTIREGLDKQAVIDTIKSNLTEEYFKKIAFEANYVSYAKVGAVIIDTEGVLDYQNLKMNNGTINIEIPEKSIAVMGGITAT